jgi:hypothetical protein
MIGRFIKAVVVAAVLAAVVQSLPTSSAIRTAPDVAHPDRDLQSGQTPARRAELWKRSSGSSYT